MSNCLVICLSDENLCALGSVRLQSDLQICCSKEKFWVKGSGSESTRRLFSSLPADSRYELNQDDLLIPLGSRVPVMKLPVAHWQSLSDFFEVELPVCALPAKSPKPVEVSLLRIDEVKQTNAMMTDLNELHCYVQKASALRFEHLKYVICMDKAFIWGTPLPAIKGNYFCIDNKVAIPAGLGHNCINNGILRKVLGVNVDDFVILYEDASWTRFSEKMFRKITRSSVSMSAGSTDENQ